MSLLPKESIKIIAEAAGVANLREEIAAQLSSDVEYRIREIAQEAIKFMKRSKRETLTTGDISSALRLRNVEALYGFSASDPLQFRKAVGTKDLFYLADKELDFADIISAPLPKCPRDTSLTAHWLAVEGVQPDITQNPRNTGGAAITPQKRKITPVPVASESTDEVKPIVKHVLSKEMQLYFERITVAVKGNNQEVLEAALNSLRSDPSLHQLLPYFTQFISDEVTHNLRNLVLLKQLMRMMKSILDSQYLHVEPYLHQMMPPILTCLVGKNLCQNASENHWELRDYAASLVACICSKFGGAYYNLQPRITGTLVYALQDVTKPLTTHYGAIVGISALGFRVTEKLIPNLKEYVKVLVPEIQSSNIVKREEASKCHEVLLKAVGAFLNHVFLEEKRIHNDASAQQKIETEYKDVLEAFGPALMPLATLPEVRR